MILVNAHVIVAVIGNICRCQPVSAYWNVSEYRKGTSHCVNVLTFDIFNAVCFSDEERLVFNGKTPSKPTYNCMNAFFTSSDYHRNIWMADIGAETGGLFFVIFISSFSIVCAIVRLIALIIYAKLPNTDWALPLIPFISVMEAYVALITSSIPAIYPLMFRPKSDPRSLNLQQRWRFDEEWLSNVNTLSASRPDTGSSNGVTRMENGWTPANDKAAIGVDVSRENRNSFYEIPSSTVSRTPSVAYSPSPSSKKEEAASAVAVE
ncbi:hypothetical protein MMC29_003594 [Sticta canariensis]|nr:hypothetical protein [Sticta canariensis]